MASLKFTTIIPIATYCFILAAYFLFLSYVIIVANRVVLFGRHDLLAWLPVAACGIFACGLVGVGLGLLRGKNLCWKILFFLLSICISSVASLILIILGFWVFGKDLIGPYILSNPLSSAVWFSFVGAFSSEIVVLYYLTQPEMIAAFGGLGELNPF